MGLDTDSPETPQAIMDFAEVSNIPIMTVNILYALPNTALYTRLEKDNRVLMGAESEDRDSNIVFLQPYENVVRNWQKVIGDVFSPEKLYARYAYNAIHTYPNRIKPKNPAKQATWDNISRAIKIFGRIIWRVGIRSDYRRLFWKMAWTELRARQRRNHVSGRHGRTPSHHLRARMHPGQDAVVQLLRPPGRSRPRKPPTRRCVIGSQRPPGAGR